MAKEQTTVRVTRKVKVIAGIGKGKYTNIPYQYALPQSASTRQWLTGQENVITWSTKMVARPNGGEDMVWVPNKDITKLSADDRRALQMGDNPFIINPGDHILVLHGYTYDNSYDAVIESGEGADKEIKRVYINPKDHAELTAILAAPESPVAKSKSVYSKAKHNFYVDDKEVEAQRELDREDLEFEAAEFARKDIGSGRYSELILFLGYMIPEYKIKPEILSDTRMKALIFKACREHPDAVLKYKGPKAERYVFALKAIRHGIITVDHNLNYKYGDVFLGVHLDSVVEWMSNTKENGYIVSKWQKILGDKIEESSKIEV